jgi:amicoumacin kinase
METPMRPDLIARFSDQVRSEAARRFDLIFPSEQTLDGFENVVLEASRDRRPYILRLTHHSHRTFDHVRAELDWLDFLAGHGVAVCRPIRSIEGSLVECLESDGDRFMAVVFERAPGRPVRRSDWTRAMTYNRGRLIGRMHALTRMYRPGPGQPRRFHWYEEDDFTNYADYLPAEDETIAERFADLQAALRTVAPDPDSFGLIHMDAHTGNMFFDGDRPTLFDFDDCCYDFFVSDIAISLFYAALNYAPEQERIEFSREFLHTFLEGYRSEHALDNRWRELIPMILKRREIVLYVAIHHGFDPDSFDEWCRAYRNEHRVSIIDGTPYLDLDWSEFDLGG